MYFVTQSFVKFEDKKRVIIYISIELPLVHKTLWSVETIEYLILYIETFEFVTSYPEKFSKKFKLIPV